jgi:hypothetical protein
LPPGPKERCEKLVGDLNGQISDLQGEISGQQQRKALAQKTSDEAAAKRDELRALVDKLRDEYNNAVKRLADGTYQAAVAAAEADLKVQEEALKKATAALEEARRIQERIEKDLSIVKRMIDDIKDVVDRYNLITLAVRNWLGDIEISSEEYIKASHRAGLKMLTNAGTPIGEYTRWFECYGQVFVAEPRQIGQIGCLLKDHLTQIKAEFDKLIDSMPEPLRWLIFPTRELQTQALKRLEPELQKAKLRIWAFLTDPTTADFVSLLSNPQNATREKLNEVFREDKSTKSLLIFSEVATLVDRDLRVSAGQLDGRAFAALAHAVTLAKLTLLGPSELNQLVRDLAGDYESRIYGKPIYGNYQGNFTLLFDAVRSIDGNHQWQAFGLPYPRRLGVKHGKPHGLHYGHNFHHDRAKGLRIWVDPHLREKVFLALFPTGVLGALSERAELQAPAYDFPACPRNPFPSTQGIDGSVRDKDDTCSRLISTAATDCTFLGKRSALNTTDLNNMPFGQPILSQLRTEQGRNDLRGKRLQVISSGLHVRSKCPDVVDGRAYYGSTVSALTQNDHVVFREIREYRYQQDVFYWGLVDRVEKSH